ncbi:MarR family winged helix-turn-helix transcriptional regulator [Vibrio sp. VB16]|uniref:MarR family winged helix-turn-helix transcriptional regulator n=1 Tax=Vibrio sp. VB16 TaxID=2785746 RepID=UPI00189DEE6A|nr:MarR family transcriptional regulator [Vibrio sp. VB16]UGA57273.1 MarR family transcriptional regulator [Vibrio sp. VB16]
MTTKKEGETFTQIVLEIFRVSGMLNAEGDEISEEYGLSSARWKVMGAIVTSEGLLTVPQIGRSMGQSRQATQRVVDIMANDGLLEWVVNPSHKRAKYVDLTEEGMRIYRLLDTKQRLWAMKAENILTEDELKQTLSALQKMARYFED